MFFFVFVLFCIINCTGKKKDDEEKRKACPYKLRLRNRTMEEGVENKDALDKILEKRYEKKSRSYRNTTQVSEYPDMSKDTLITYQTKERLKSSTSKPAQKYTNDDFVDSTIEQERQSYLMALDLVPSRQQLQTFTNSDAEGAKSQSIEQVDAENESTMDMKDTYVENLRETSLMDSTVLMKLSTVTPDIESDKEILILTSSEMLLKNDLMNQDFAPSLMTEADLCKSRSVNFTNDKNSQYTHGDISVTENPSAFAAFLKMDEVAMSEKPKPQEQIITVPYETEDSAGKITEQESEGGFLTGHDLVPEQGKKVKSLDQEPSTSDFATRGLSEDKCSFTSNSKSEKAAGEKEKCKVKTLSVESEFSRGKKQKIADSRQNYGLLTSVLCVESASTSKNLSSQENIIANEYSSTRAGVSNPDITKETSIEQVKDQLTELLVKYKTKLNVQSSLQVNQETLLVMRMYNLVTLSIDLCDLKTLDSHGSVENFFVEHEIKTRKLIDNSTTWANEIYAIFADTKVPFFTPRGKQHTGYIKSPFGAVSLITRPYTSSRSRYTFNFDFLNDGLPSKSLSELKELNKVFLDTNSSHPKLCKVLRSIVENEYNANDFFTNLELINKEFLNKQAQTLEECYSYRDEWLSSKDLMTQLTLLCKHHFEFFLKTDFLAKAIMVPEFLNLHEFLPRGNNVFFFQTLRDQLLTLYGLVNMNHFFSSLTKERLKEMINTRDCGKSNYMLAIYIVLIREYFMISLFEGLKLHCSFLLRYIHYYRHEFALFLESRGPHLCLDPGFYNPFNFFFFKLFIMATKGKHRTVFKQSEIREIKERKNCYSKYTIILISKLRPLVDLKKTLLMTLEKQWQRRLEPNGMWEIKTFEKFNEISNNSKSQWLSRLISDD